MTKNISYVFVLSAALLWGSAPAVTKLLLVDLDSLQILFFNNLFALMGLLVVVLVRRQLAVVKSYTRKDYIIFASLGFLGTFLYTLFFINALKTLPAQEVSAINYFWPVVAVISAAIILKEKINPRKTIGVISSFLGVVIVATQGNFSFLRFNSASGVFFAIAGAVVFGVFSVLGKRYNREQLTSTLLCYLFGTLYSLLTVLFFSGLSLPSWSQLFGLIWFGAFTSGFAFVFWFLALEYGDTAKMSSMIFLTPFISLVYIHFLVGEKITISSVAGLIVIVAGIFIQSKWLPKQKSVIHSP